MPPLGGDPSFTLFEGATFTGGLLVRAEAFQRARLGRDFAVESAFMGLADFCVTRGIEIWPYAQPVFDRLEQWTMGPVRPLPARVTAVDDCSTTDRYYMLAAGYGARTNQRAGSQRKLAALAMIDLGLLRVVRYASWTRRRIRGIRSRLLPSSPSGPLPAMERMTTLNTASAFAETIEVFSKSTGGAE